MATIKDIAKLSGYSIGTVSRVINHHPDVSDKAKDAIKKVIEQEKYQPNTNAKLMKLKSSNIIAIIIKGYANMFFSELLEQLQSSLDAAEQEVSIYYLDEDGDEVETAYHIYVEKKPKGFIFLGGSLEHYDQYFKDADVPSVLLTNDAKHVQNPYVSSYTTDNLSAGAFAVQYLIDHGHTQIGVIGGNPHSHTANDRLVGAAKQMQKQKIYFDETFYEPGRYSFDGGYTAMNTLLSRHPDITAVFALADTIAIGALRCIKDHQLDVPKDISVIGFDGIDLGQYCIPRLTTIYQDIEKMSKNAAENILLRMNYHKAAEHECIPFEIIQGKTVANRK
ncbi:LacI family DNA-binding transcriptional regulator [Absicoccus porci]|uniref:LacI family DNA-binding transcriptional regulator n=1 Tax=Absicoccus porci TaxID=2486576 RepID=UPI002941E711|nr:LacI family DNA-binding transcriptional regulator [Absicoccus porci]